MGDKAKIKTEHHTPVRSGSGTMHSTSQGKSAQPAFGGQQVWQCTYCSAVFRNKFSFNRHHKRHLGEYKCHCPVCDKGFMETEHLKGHMSNQHGAPKSYRCEYCEQSFSYSQGLKSHMIGYHNMK